MDLFEQLHYRYPATSNMARCTISQRPQGSPHDVSAQNMPSTQNQTYPADMYLRRSRPSLDFTSSHGSHPQQRSASVGQRGAVHSDPTNLIKMHYMDEPASLSDQYIPSSSDKITCTDHRPLDEIFASIRPSSSRWSQAKSGSLRPLQNGTPRGLPRHTSVVTYPLPSKPQLDGVVQIPLLAVDNQIGGTGLVVDFRCSDWGIGVQVEGIPMSDLLHGNVSGLENPRQCVFDGLNLIDLRLNILWPNYPPFAKVISAFGTDSKPLTRAGLGYEVSLAFAEFFYQITSRSIPPAQPGPYTISTSSTGSPSPGIRFDQLHLITVRNTSRGEWTAEIRAVGIVR